MALLEDLPHLFRTIPVVRWALEAQMALSADCCEVSCLARLDQAIVEAKAICYTDLQHHKLRGVISAMVIITQVSVSRDPEHVHILHPKTR